MRNVYWALVVSAALPPARQWNNDFQTAAFAVYAFKHRRKGIGQR
jgi:hypothetical protein